MEFSLGNSEISVPKGNSTHFTHENVLIGLWEHHWMRKKKKKRKYKAFRDSELLFLHHVFRLGQHVYTGTCLHANDTQTAGSLENGMFQVHCWKKSGQWKSTIQEEWTEKLAFILPPTSTWPMCWICQTIAVMKISYLKRHYELKHGNFEETFPQNLEVRRTKMNWNHHIKVQAGFFFFFFFLAFFGFIDRVAEEFGQEAG